MVVIIRDGRELDEVSYGAVVAFALDLNVHQKNIAICSRISGL